MKEYTMYLDITEAQKEVVQTLISNYKKIKKLENKIKEIKNDNSINREKVEKHIKDKKLEGIQGNDFLLFLKDCTNAPSFKSVVEEATDSKVINNTIASKLFSLYENGKKSNKKLSVKLSIQQNFFLQR